MTQPCIDLN